MKEEIKRLHEKIFALTGNKHVFSGGRPQSAKPKQKAIFPANENLKVELQHSKKQINELVLIIDELKTTKFSLEAQLKEKQSHEKVSRVPRGPAGLNNN
jgi:phage shock protein A